MKDKASQNIKSAVNKLQSASPKIRMRWAVGLTAITAILVLFIWVQSLDSVIGSSGSSNLLSVESSKNGEKGLIKNLRVRTAQTIVYFQRKLGEKNEIVIEN